MTIDITVPYDDDQWRHRVRSEWQRQGGGAHTPVPTLTLPRRGDGSFTIRMRTRKMADVVVQDIRTGEVAGACQADDQIMTMIPQRGTARFTVARQTYTVGAGLLSVSRNQPVFDWEADADTSATVLILPAHDLRFPQHQRPVTAGQDTPAARLLLAHLGTWASLHDELSPADSWAARSAALELFQGLLRNQVVDDEPFSAALVRAAMEWMDSRLLDDRDLNPRTVAAALHVSVRTLHRAFASEATSVMGYVRERRLERARSELMTTSLAVSEIAARWHFADGSHFVKAYRRRFGEPPTALPHSRDPSA